MLELSGDDYGFLSFCVSQRLTVSNRLRLKACFAVRKTASQCWAHFTSQCRLVLYVEPRSTQRLSRQDVKAMSDLCLEAALYHLQKNALPNSGSPRRELCLEPSSGPNVLLRSRGQLGAGCHSVVVGQSQPTSGSHLYAYKISDRSEHLGLEVAYMQPF